MKRLFITLVVKNKRGVKEVIEKIADLFDMQIGEPIKAKRKEYITIDKIDL